MYTIDDLDINFAVGKYKYRQQSQQHSNELLIKAIGLKKYGLPLTVLDTTAGLAQDAFVLASYGCDVTLVERQTALAKKLQAAIESKYDCEFINSNTSRLHLLQQSSHDVLSSTQTYDVIYIDPMFPANKKTALPNKNMQILQTIVGHDNDADHLLELALQQPCKRVVVKRGKNSPYLANLKPEHSYQGKACRFDIYARQSIHADT